MRTVIKNSFLAGVGLISMTRDKAKQTMDELVKFGEVRSDEVDGYIEKLVKRGEEERDALRKLVRDEVTHVLDEMNLATKDDVNHLKTEISKTKKS